MFVLEIFIFKMGRDKNSSYFQNYQVNLLNHVTHLALPTTEKTSQNQISLSTCVLLFTISLLSIDIVPLFKGNQMYAKILADQIKERAKRNLKILEKSLELKNKKN